jgi:hypothetical protein
MGRQKSSVRAWSASRLLPINPDRTQPIGNLRAAIYKDASASIRELKLLAYFRYKPRKHLQTKLKQVTEAGVAANEIARHWFIRIGCDFASSWIRRSGSLRRIKQSF